MADDALLNWHYPCSSDEYAHGLLGEPRDLPDEVYALQARFFREADFSKADPWEDFKVN